MRRRHRSSLAFVLPALAAACGGGGTDLPDPDTCSTAANCRLELVSGDMQSQTVGAALEMPLVVKIVHSSGNPVPPVQIVWRAVGGEGTVAERTMTDAAGLAQATATLGTTAGAQVYEASIEGIDGATVRFDATAVAGEANRLEKVSGDGQSAIAGNALPDRLVVRVVDQYGNPVEGWRVAWYASVGGGEVSDLVNITDAAGEASAVGVLGSESGADNNLFTANAQGQLDEDEQLFLASADPAPPALMARVSGDNQGGTRGQPVPEPFVVRIVDRFANPVAGVTVTWAAGEGDGSILPATVETNEDGEAQGFATLGPAPGAHQFTASVPDVDGAPMTFVANAFPPICSADEWCWISPVPQGNDVRAAYPISPTELWLVGDHGTSLRYNGAAWQGFETGTTANLTGVWGAASDDVWATSADGAILHFDGTRWRSAATGLAQSLAGIWGAAADDIWAVGDRGTVLHYDGMMWSPTGVLSPDVNLFGVWGRSATEIWVVGSRGALWARDNDAWTRLDTGTTEDLYDVWADDSGELWTVGNRATIQHFDGAQWNRISPPTSDPLYAVWGDSDRSVYLAGGRGSIVYFDGQRYTNDVSSTSNTIYDVVRVADDYLLAVGEAGIVMRRGAGGWIPEAENVPLELQGVWGATADDVWAVGFRSTILHWDGVVWSRAEAQRGQHYAVHGVASDAVFAAGGAGSLFTWDGTAWTDHPRPTLEDLYGVFAVSATAAWAGGVGGNIVKYDGTRWTSETSPTINSIYGIYGETDDNLWAVGDFGTMLRYDGTTWTQTATTPTGQSLLAIRGASEDDIWAAGASGVVLHYDGVTWQAVDVGTNRNLYNIHVVAPNDVWIVGDEGTLLHYDGVTWLHEESGTANRLLGVYGAEPDELWVVGEKRSILRKDRSP